MKSSPPGALSVLLRTDPALCQQLQEAIQSFAVQPKERAPSKKAQGCHSQLDPVLSAQLQAAIQNFASQPKEEKPVEGDPGRIDQVTIDTRASTPSAAPAEPTAAGWTADDVEACVSRTLSKLERPRKAAERLLRDLLPELSLPKPWVTFRSSKGKLFFLNPTSRATTWRHPLELALQEMGAFCKSLLELDDAWRVQLLSGQLETIDAEEQEELSKWQLTSPGHWRHVSGQTASANPALHISASAACKRLALHKLQNARYLSELLLLEPPALPAPKQRDPNYIAKAIQWFMHTVDDDSSCTPTPPATGRSHLGASPTGAQAALPPASSKVEISKGPSPVDMDSDGLMTFSLSERKDTADAGSGQADGKEDVAVKEADEPPKVSVAADPPPTTTTKDEPEPLETPEMEQSMPPKASAAEDLRSEGSGSEVEHFVQQLATVLDATAGHSGSQNREAGVPQAADADASGLAQLLQHVSEILAGQMQSSGADKKATNSSGEAKADVPGSAAQEEPRDARKDEKATSEDPGSGPHERDSAVEATTSASVPKVEVKGDPAENATPRKGHDLQAQKPTPVTAAAADGIKPEVKRRLANFDPTDPAKEAHAIEYIIEHMSLLDSENTGRIPPGKLCLFFQLLGMDVFDLTQAIAASNLGSKDGDVDYAAFVRWLMTSGG